MTQPADKKLDPIVEKPVAAPAATQMGKPLSLAYKDARAESRTDRVNFLSNQLRLSGGMARSCEEATDERTAEFDLVALEVVYDALAARPRKVATGEASSEL